MNAIACYHQDIPQNIRDFAELKLNEVVGKLVQCEEYNDKDGWQEMPKGRHAIIKRGGFMDWTSTTFVDVCFDATVEGVNDDNIYISGMTITVDSDWNIIEHDLNFTIINK